ncbi:LysR substrate-binding domain-containing protein [Natronohydrobacter thiooxidans]|uniref:LysR substrate-binding domain-containing protein n=1 Tax=Natronohydrobacter thiooxidans TaxID=87172 RepID=UPI000B1AC1B6|nr:LysR substrate-binding domain-containing protein [Natronohydrobacter thiooxidans]
MRHRQIEAFRAVMAARTFTEAARMMHISQPSVSRLISDLEAGLPFRLFERQNGRVRPTPEAVLLHQETERSYESLERVFAFARDLGSFQKTQLSIAAMPALCLDILPVAAAQFHENHPDAALTIQARSSKQVVQWIMTEQCELGISAPPFDVKGVKIEMVVTCSAVCAMSAQHPLTAKKVITPSDLRDYRLIALSDSTITHHIEKIMQNEGLSNAPIITTSLSIVACRMAELNLGVSLLDPFTASYLRSGKLVFRPFYPDVSFIIGVISPMGRTKSRGQLEMLSILEQSLRSLPFAARIE